MTLVQMLELAKTQGPWRRLDYRGCSGYSIRNLDGLCPMEAAAKVKGIPHFNCLQVFKALGMKSPLRNILSAADGNQLAARPAARRIRGIMRRILEV